jgi:hypothetical protein
MDNHHSVSDAVAPRCLFFFLSSLRLTVPFLTQRFGSLRAAVLSCIRRAICFPLFRGPQVALTVLRDVLTLLRPDLRPASGIPTLASPPCSSMLSPCFGSSPRQNLRLCLLRVKYVIDHDSAKYLLSKLYLNDYCIWIQQISEETFVTWTLSQDFIVSTDISWNRDVDEIGPGWNLTSATSS